MALSEDPKGTAWATNEVITWLLNDEAIYQELKGPCSAETLKQYIVSDRYAPLGLYGSFLLQSFDQVNWEEAARTLEHYWK